MKLVCSVAVSNRLLPTLSISTKQKHVKSTLALCKNPKSTDYCIILFTNQNKTGTKYNVKGNISKILTKFINDGKATIQFKTPQHDLFLNSDVIQLKSFLHLLKRVLENKLQPNELTYSSFAVTPVSTRDMAPTKLCIKTRADYPIRGLPRTLEILHINGINRCSLDKGILNLTKLRVLDLSDNCIEHLPEAINRLPALTDLNLASNQFCNSSPKQWTWLGGKLSTTLTLLSLDSNSLKYLPDQIVKLHHLSTLNVNNNLLTTLPAGLGSLRHLKNLIASNNSITILPGSIKKLHLNEINLFNNKFTQIQPLNSSQAAASLVIKVGTLKEIAARVCLEAKLGYSSASIPSTLCHYLDHARYCVCGRACFDLAVIRANEMILISSVAQSFVLSTNQTSYLPIDCFFCSVKCYKSSTGSRMNRHPVI